MNCSVVRWLSRCGLYYFGETLQILENITEKRQETKGECGIAKKSFDA